MKTCLAKLSFESAYEKIWRDDSKDPSLPDLLRVTTCYDGFFFETMKFAGVQPRPGFFALTKGHFCIFRLQLIRKALK